MMSRRIRSLLFGALAALLAAACRGDDAAPDSNLEIIQFKAPAGWQPSDKPGQAAKIFVSPDSNAGQQTLILILLTPARD